MRDYLAVERARYGDRLTFTVTAPDDLAELAVPPLVLQPLVENAVQHGVAGRPGPGVVAVDVRRDGERLVLSVTDDGVGLGASARRGNGLGLGDLTERLRLLHRDAATVTVTAAVRGTVATITLPVEAA